MVQSNERSLPFERVEEFDVKMNEVNLKELFEVVTESNTNPHYLIGVIEATLERNDSDKEKVRCIKDALTGFEELRKKEYQRFLQEMKNNGKHH
jgi:hypothetical protein